MSAADKLAQVLAEHRSAAYIKDEDDERGVLPEGMYWGWVCTCDHVLFGDRHSVETTMHPGVPYIECVLAAHQAAVVLAHLTAEGWAQGREEFATKDGEDEGVTEIEPPTREWAERVAAADNAYLRRTGFEPNITVVRRRVTDWEPVEGEQP